MLISMVRGDKLVNTILPKKVYGSYWITDYDEKEVEFNIISIEASNNEWILKSNDDYVIMVNGNAYPSMILKNHNFYCIKDMIRKKDIFLYCSPENDPTNAFIDIKNISLLTIGSATDNVIVYQGPGVGAHHAVIEFDKGFFYVRDLGSQNGVFVNNQRLVGKKQIQYGDVIFVMGLKIIMMNHELGPYMIINNPNNQVHLKSASFAPKQLQRKESNVDYLETAEMEEVGVTNAEYYYASPRFKSNLDVVKIVIDAPPQEQKQDETPAIYIIGPMLTMGMTSCTTALVTLNGVINEGRALSSAIPSLVICGAMLMSMIFWPLINKRYQKKKIKKNELDRQVKYGKYIESKRFEIKKEVDVQTNIQRNNHIPLKECEAIISNKKRNLWDRRYDDEDFLTVSLGQGNTEAKIEIQYPEEHFSMEDDNLRQMVYSLGEEPKQLINVPITTSLKTKVSAVIGKRENIKLFMDSLFLQLMTFHSYDELKIMMITSKNQEQGWEYLKYLPHCFNNEKTLRYFAADQMEAKEIMYELDKIYRERISGEKMGKVRTHYLIVTDNFRLLRNFDIAKKIIADEHEDLGMSILIINRDLSAVPSECSHIINVEENSGFMIEKILNSNNNVKFRLDVNPYIDMKECAKKLMNIPIEIDLSGQNSLPTKYGFLEMYDVGKIEQLNVLNRWYKNNPILSLQAPIGIGTGGDIITLDLHEKYHGPHGLIAGTTGSGKSEFIITYILSLAVNYHPDEVQFILIDYKGGGLTGAFENKKTGIRLPHIAGTITNLDANEINRSLASIESELKRRQKMFNEARAKSNDSTIDIYKYQKLYRSGKVEEPISHLFIICDEFAEMKTQQSEFMQQLISTARVGRSLGVHLILATQKPSGVVDSQIWSNTRFRVCLKVQEKSDSTEVIQCPDAAYLTDTGRFYLQVGYNEIFQLGQAAWAGGNYFPSEKRKKMVDTSLEFIDNVGHVIRSIDNPNENTIVESKGEELSNIVRYIHDLATEQKIITRKLWLDKIPAFLAVDDLKEKYDYHTDKLEINPIVGEYDLPTKQTQKPLTVPITTSGNVAIYGVAGSGKENFLTTLIYSLLKEKTSDEVNLYILDFGSEALQMFEKAPIVGDIVTNGEDEKVTNLYKMLNREMEARKELMQEYGGSYESYCRNSGKTLPNIIVVLNNYEVYDDSYNQYEDALVDLSREGTKYGIYFIITSSTPNGLKLKLRQNMNQLFVLQQNNENDYSSILGNVRKQYPSKLFGRGIIKFDEVHEFQTAFVCERDTIASTVREMCEKMKGKRAPRIPVLPSRITKKDIELELHPDKIVLGIEKNTLQFSKYDFRKNVTNIIATQDIDLFSKFIAPFLKQLSENNMTYVLNAEELPIDSTISNVYRTNFDSYIDSLFSTMQRQLETYKNTNLKDKMKHITTVIVGYETLKDQLTEENKKKLTELFMQAKKLGIYHFIIFDSITKLKKNELEPWYKETVNNSTGIWFGGGLADQYTIKLSKIPKELREEIPQNFCYVINKGIATLVKFVEEYED